MWRGAETVLREAGFEPVPVAWEPEKGMGVQESADRVLFPAIRDALTARGRPAETPFHAVGHSTGGLLVRWLAEQTESPGAREQVRSVALLSTPNQGARTGVARIACQSFRQPWRSLACDLIPGSVALRTLGTKAAGDMPYLTVGVETLPNLLPVPFFDGDGDGVAHSHDNAVMAESAWLDGATFRIWRGRKNRSHFTVSCSSTVNDWLVAFLRGEALPEQATGRQPSEDLCRGGRHPNPASPVN